MLLGVLADLDIEFGFVVGRQAVGDASNIRFVAVFIAVVDPYLLQRLLANCAVDQLHVFLPAPVESWR